MIRYSYNQQLTPPAPFVHVTVRPPERGIAVSDLPALLDPAADITVGRSCVWKLNEIRWKEVEIGSRTRVAPKATVKRCSGKRPVSRPSTVCQNRWFFAGRTQERSSCVIRP
jgi:hypothetical protein